MQYQQPNTKEVAAAAVQLWQELLFKFPDGPTAEMMETMAALHAVVCRESAAFMVRCGAPKHLATIDAVHQVLQASEKVYVQVYKEILND